MRAQNGTDLWATALQFVKQGAASDLVTLRSLLMEERDHMESNDRPSDADIGRMVERALAPALASESSVDEVAAPAKSRRPKVLAPDASELAIATHIAAGKMNRLLRWSCMHSAWMEWKGTHWHQSQKNVVPLVLQAEVKRAVSQGLAGHTIEPKAVSRLASATGIRGIASLLAAWPSVWLSDEMDPPGLLACPRGVLDLSTGEWLPHDHQRPITKCCPVDPGKESPLWTMVDAHLRKCLGDLYGATQRILGSSLRGLGADRRVLWLHGPGGDGKSTLATIIRLGLGQHAVSVPAEVFGEGGTRGAHGHELAAGMAGAKIAFALEVGMRLDWGKLKALSGGDEQTTKRMHGKAFKYQRPPVLVLVSNDKPVPPDRAAAERLIVAGMLPPDDPDERLMEAAKSPGKDRDLLASACLQWLIEGCADFIANGLGPVPLCSHAPAGLERWWAEVVANGTIIPGSGLSSVHEIRATLMPNEESSNRELSAFLKTVVPFKRTNEGSRYGLTVRSDSK